jgi:hypothetical protein
MRGGALRAKMGRFYSSQFLMSNRFEVFSKRNNYQKVTNIF